MNILICSDGTDPADNPNRLGGLFATACGASVTILGIAEQSADDQSLRRALQAEADGLRKLNLSPQVVIRAGDPVAEILQQTSAVAYDLVVVGSRRKRSTGLHWRSERTYEVIKAIPPPVLIATGVRDSMKKLLVCTGGKRYIDNAVNLTGRLAVQLGASVTLLHVAAEPPALYADLVLLEEDVGALLASGSELGRNLLRQKEGLEKLGVTTEVCVRHGLVVDQVFQEVRAGGHDLIVTGTSQARGTLRHYIMGDVTRSIVNRANCPVLVARAGKEIDKPNGFWDSLKQLFAGSGNPTN